MTDLITGLIGYPTDHSLSPRIHAYWMMQHGIVGHYKLFTTQPSRLRQTMHHMRKKNWRGVNITVPHKQAVMEYLDTIDPIATRIGAVNTITNTGGELAGTNTDAYGFIASLREGLGEGFLPSLSNVVVLGAGGATRAVIAGLLDAGAKSITLTNRTFATAQQMADTFGISALPWDVRQETLADARLLVNTTCLGMTGKPPLDITLTDAHRCAVADIVYAPLETPLLAAARARGLATVDGLGMLLYQAQAAFKHWHGIEPEVTPALRAQIQNDIP